MTKKIDEDLRGFKDFLSTPKALNKLTPRRHDSQLVTFLEQETARIDKLTRLFSEKSINLKNYPHQQKIKEEITIYNKELREKLIKVLSQKDSPLIKSLSELFTPHFRF